VRQVSFTLLVGSDKIIIEGCPFKKKKYPKAKWATIELFD